jgi:hypothetical protein
MMINQETEDNKYRDTTIDALTEMASAVLAAVGEVLSMIFSSKRIDGDPRKTAAPLKLTSRELPSD